MPSFYKENENKNGANIDHNMKVRNIFIFYF